MTKGKKIREKGKIPFSKYFQKFKEGDIIAVVKDLAVPSNFPKRLQGRTGKVESQRGKSYVVKIKDQNKEKTHIIEPIHLIKIKQIQKNDNRQ